MEKERGATASPLNCRGNVRFVQGNLARQERNDSGFHS